MIDPLYLENLQEESLLLWIDGYEFPHIENEPYDSNWLNIGIEVQLKQGNWTKIFPCALTTELEQLVQWFIDIGAEKNKTDYFGFIEPNLSFEVSDSTPSVLTIIFSAELRPKWADSNERFQLKILLDRATLLQVITSLEAQLEHYPSRSKDNE